MMLSRSSRCLVWICFFGAGLAWESNAHGALMAFLNNPSFDSVSVSDGGIDATVHGWIEGDKTGAATGANAFIMNPPDANFFPTGQYPAPTDGNQYAMLNLRNTETSTQTYLYQLIGAVDASDVGKTFRFSADFGSRLQNSGKTATGTQVSLRTNVTQTDFGGNAVGASGQDITGSIGSLGDGTDFGELFVEWEITPDVVNDFLGQNIYAVISVASSVKASASDQYFVDNAQLTLVGIPEPGTGLLVVGALLGLIPCATRRRALR